MTYRFDGKRNPERRAAVERGDPIVITEYDYRAPWAVPFDRYVKIEPTYAVQIGPDFEVDTIEGLHSAKGSDYLAIGADGEMYPIARDIFEKTYKRDENG